MRTSVFCSRRFCRQTSVWRTCRTWNSSQTTLTTCIEHCVRTLCVCCLCGLSVQLMCNLCVLCLCGLGVYPMSTLRVLGIHSICTLCLCDLHLCVPCICIYSMYLACTRYVLCVNYVCVCTLHMCVLCVLDVYSGCTTCQCVPWFCLPFDICAQHHSAVWQILHWSPDQSAERRSWTHNPENTHTQS